MKLAQKRYKSFELTRLIEKEERYESRERCANLALKLLRVTIHGLLTLIVLASAVATKGSLLFIAHGISNNKVHNVRSKILKSRSIKSKPI
jgi:hypothetical protein